MQHIRNIFILGCLTVVFCVVPIYTHAAEDCSINEVYSNTAGICVPKFTPLVGIPFIDTAPSDMKLADYVNALYLASISIAAFMAVVKIIFAGVKYMLSDVVTTKEDAKKDIRGALIGLLIVVGAVLILNTINPKLTGLGALDDIQGVHMTLIKPNNTPTSVEDISTEKEACATRSSEGYIYRVREVGTLYNPKLLAECCIPNKTCSQDTNIDVDTDIQLDTSKIYTQEEYTTLVSEISSRGIFVYTPSDIVFGETDRMEQTCKLREGVPYIILKERPYTNPQKILFCIKK